MNIKRSVFFIAFAILVTSTVSNTFAQCNQHKIAREFKPNLAPYRYDSYNYKDITFTDKPQTIEVTFTAFAGMKYKLVFGTSLFDENVQVNIYDKSMRNGNRNLLYKNSSGIDNLFWFDEVQEPGMYYIDYTIPPKGNFKSDNGCMVLLIGYQQQ